MENNLFGGARLRYLSIITRDTRAIFATFTLYIILRKHVQNIENK